jgi:hypothetical protein
LPQDSQHIISDFFNRPLGLIKLSFATGLDSWNDVKNKYTIAINQKEQTFIKQQILQINNLIEVLERPE